MWTPPLIKPKKESTVQVLEIIKNYCLWFADNLSMFVAHFVYETA